MRKTGLLPSEMSPRVSCGEGVVLACCHSCSDQTAPGPLCPRPAGAGLFRLCLGSGLLGGNIMGGRGVLGNAGRLLSFITFISFVCLLSRFSIFPSSKRISVLSEPWRRDNLFMLIRFILRRSFTILLLSTAPFISNGRCKIQHR